MPSREFVMACIESSYGTAKASPVLGTDNFFLRLSEQAAFEAELLPQADQIMYGGGRTTPAAEVCDVWLAQGQFATILYPGVTSQILLNWALGIINSGRTTPWTTTDAAGVMPPGDLASLSWYRAFINPDGSYVRERWNGCKCTKGKLSFSDDPKSRKLILSGEFVGIKSFANSVDSSLAPDAVEFPNPAETDYPSVQPWLFSHIGRNTGTCKIGSGRTQITDLSIEWTNNFDLKTYESQFLQLARFTGRSTTATVGLRYKPSPDDLASYQSRALQDSEFKLDNGTNTLKIDFNAVNRISARKRDFSSGKEYAAQVTLQNFWDPALATDLALTLT